MKTTTIKFIIGFILILLFLPNNILSQEKKGSSAQNKNQISKLDEDKIPNKFEVRNFNNQIFIKVLKGNLKLSNGTTAQPGSELPVNEEWISFEEGETLFIVAEGGVNFKGKSYSEGTKLVISIEGLIEKVQNPVKK